MKSSIRKSSTKDYQSTFTYFIPAPPVRSDGYREREIDKIIRGLVDEGFTIEDIQMQTLNHGVLILFLLKTKSKKIFLKDKDQELHLKFSLNCESPISDIIHEHETF